MTISILMGIIWELLQHKKLTAKQISEKYEISIRSVYRYVDALCSSGFPVITYVGKNGGISIEPSCIIKNNYFTKNEINYLLELSSNSNNINDEIKSLNEKLKYLYMNNNS